MFREGGEQEHLSEMTVQSSEYRDARTVTQNSSQTNLGVVLQIKTGV